MFCIALVRNGLVDLSLIDTSQYSHAHSCGGMSRCRNALWEQQGSGFQRYILIDYATLEHVVTLHHIHCSPSLTGVVPLFTSIHSAQLAVDLGWALRVSPTRWEGY